MLGHYVTSLSYENLQAEINSDFRFQISDFGFQNLKYGIIFIFKIR
jgi:hypothetical protein